MTHTDGFIPVEAADVLYLLKHVEDTQFWRLSTWPQLFIRCSCCDAERIGPAYQMIGAAEARQRAEEHSNA